MTATISIPLNQLVAWNGNVRKIAGAKEGLAELAASIKAHGLINPLAVRPGTDGKYEVGAGSRRHAALLLLAKNGDIPADHPIPCKDHKGVDDTAFLEISLAENRAREDMHPADEFDAFKALADQGESAAEIAGRFGIIEKDVIARLKLARVSPVIVKAFRDDKIGLECVMAFAVTDDHKRQERFWKSAPGWQKERPRDIRLAMTEGEITAADRRVRYVTLDAYEKAGGTVRRDLFTDGESGIFITKPDLLAELASAKIERKKQSLLKDGWKWVEVLADNDHETIHKHKPILPAGSKDTFKREQMANAGVFLRIGYEGKLEIKPGYVRREDIKAARASAAGDKPPQKKPAEKAGLSQALLADLTAERTAAIAARLATSPRVALVAIVHGLGMQHFYKEALGSTVGFSLKYTNHPLGFAERAKSRAIEELSKFEQSWKKQIPQKQGDFWQWCIKASDKTLMSLLAFCLAQGCTNGDQLATPLSLDMADWFTPNAQNYFGRIGKPDILQAIKEATGKPVAPATEKLKKSDLAAFADRVVKGTGWMPKFLRTVSRKADSQPLKKAA